MSRLSGWEWAGVAVAGWFLVAVAVGFAIGPVLARRSRGTFTADEVGLPDGYDPPSAALAPPDEDRRASDGGGPAGG